MSKVRKEQAAPKRGVTLRHRPKASDASLERLRQLAGIVTLKGPLPSKKFLGE